ncbi:hypothetical protein PINS_up005956 [Pythium insidiosum]|nr:hypothetical protein PINS_up005956 [Pythium insidiosum]
MSDAATRGASKAGARGGGKPRGRKPKPNGAASKDGAAAATATATATAPAADADVDLLEEKRPARKDSVASSRKDSMLSCILCCHAIDNVTRFNTVGACGHTGCCSLCALRMRQLLGTTACPFCKADLPRVICVEHEHQTFDSFQDWGDNIGPTHVFDDASGMFFLKRDMPRVRRLREPMCPRCDKKLSTVAALKTHLQDVHQQQYCGICLEHKKVFLQEQELFTKEQLKAHAAKGNPREGFAGHPRCDFCFSRFYSNTELFDHLHKNHFECDICVRSLGVQNRYYKDYPDLENHFRAEHFLCEEPSCLAKKFVVFKSHIDFQAHMATEHPHIKISRKIDVHFTVRRAANNDSGGGGGSGGGSGADQWTAASSGSDHVINVADFPSLADNGAAPSQLQFWQGQTVTRPRMEDFPELPTASASRGGGNAVSAASVGFRNALAPPPTPAMLAHMGGAGSSWEYPELAAAAEALGANNPLMRFVKPAKGKKGKKGPRASPSSASQSQRRDAEEKAAVAAAQQEAEEEEEQESGPDMSKSALVLKIRQVLGSDAKYEVFREACKQYRLAEVDVASFYSKVRAMFPTEELFAQLFLKLMKLSPDRAQVDAVMAHHRQQTGKQSKAQGFQEKKQPKKAEKKNRAPAPAVRMGERAAAKRALGAGADRDPRAAAARAPLGVDLEQLADGARQHRGRVVARAAVEHQDHHGARRRYGGAHDRQQHGRRVVRTVGERRAVRCGAVARAPDELQDGEERLSRAAQGWQTHWRAARDARDVGRAGAGHRAEPHARRHTGQEEEQEEEHDARRVGHAVLVTRPAHTIIVVERNTTMSKRRSVDAEVRHDLVQLGFDGRQPRVHVALCGRMRARRRRRRRRCERTRRRRAAVARGRRRRRALARSRLAVLAHDLGEAATATASSAARGPRGGRVPVDASVSLVIDHTIDCWTSAKRTERRWHSASSAGCHPNELRPACRPCHHHLHHHHHCCCCYCCYCVRRCRCHKNRYFPWLSVPHRFYSCRGTTGNTSRRRAETILSWLTSSTWSLVGSVRADYRAPDRPSPPPATASWQHSSQHSQEQRRCSFRPGRDSVTRSSCSRRAPSVGPTSSPWSAGCSSTPAARLVSTQTPRSSVAQLLQHLAILGLVREPRVRQVGAAHPSLPNDRTLMMERASE